ncbi:MAG TPA: hypothetical protein VKZ18_22875 [Polyangia bacterium]|nr:hypothetical protein [Polyangia bacterium]
MSEQTPTGPGTPELVPTAGGAGAPRLDHLSENRRLIVRRSLLATAVGGAVPLPVLDDYLAGRVRAGMLIKLGERRQVDIAPSSAELLGDPREGTAVRNATLTAATLLALKLAWRKFFALLALGRRAEDMATTFQLGILFDHYCAKLHVGGEIDRTQAAILRYAIHGALGESERAALVTAFREGGRVLGRSALEAPAWMSARIERAAKRWAESGGRTADPGEGGDPAGGPGAEDEARWLDRASSAVEDRIGRAGHGYLVNLVASFERRLKDAVEAARKDPGFGRRAEASDEPPAQR